jgi:hypothetical protein
MCLHTSRAAAPLARGSGHSNPNETSETLSRSFLSYDATQVTVAVKVGLEYATHLSSPPETVDVFLGPIPQMLAHLALVSSTTTKQT